MATASTGGDAVVNGVKLVGEGLVVPGSSLLLDGDVTRGIGHALAGVVAQALIGPLGWFLVAANSYATSVSGQNLVQTVKK